LYYNDIFEVPLPENHRFPMAKYRMVREKLQKEFEGPLVHFKPSPVTTERELSTTHCPDYIHRYFTGQLSPSELRRTGFPWSLEQVNRSASSVGGTVAAMRTVLQSDTLIFTGHIAGGTHHAFFDYGEGFCIFSDIAVAANLALEEFSSKIKKIVIIDLDVHQGNGNAELFRNRNEVYTFSMHCKGNIFSERKYSDLDIELDTNVSDEEYLRELEQSLTFVVNSQHPDLVFFQAGVDIFQNDKLGKLSISREGLRKRNQMVFDVLSQQKIKSVVTMGGGYPADLNPQSPAFQEIVDCHADVYKQCIRTVLKNM
jgi:acetoin utilization deacetylase AcuC-like enzyme